MAFLLLCFFMMTTTMDQDKGLSRRLPPMPDPNHKLEDQKVNKRNIVVVKINSQDRLLVGSKPMLVSELREEVKRFIRNPYGDETLPEKKDTTITYMNKPYEFQVSKGNFLFLHGITDCGDHIHGFHQNSNMDTL